MTSVEGRTRLDRLRNTIHRNGRCENFKTRSSIQTNREKRSWLAKEMKGILKPKQAIGLIREVKKRKTS
jgi:hypothetical protein